MPIQKTLNQNFFKGWSSEMAYVLGYFAADGSMLLNNRGGYYIEFTSCDRVLISIVQRVTGSSHYVSARERGGNCKTAYRIQIGSTAWFEDLLKLGFTQNKSNTPQFPQVPNEFFAHFVRGYFDGDGCAYFKEHWAKDHGKMKWSFQTHFTSGSYEFLKVLLQTLKEYGVKGGCIAPKSKSGFELQFSRHDSLALYRLMYHTAVVTNLFLPRKRRTLERAILILKLEKKVTKNAAVV
jgi:hypothetical protein